MNKIHLSQYKKITFLTGAGCSTDLGLPTFEEIYADKDVMNTMRIDVLKSNPEKVWKVLGARKPKVFEIHNTNKHWSSFYQWFFTNYLQGLESEVTIVTTNTDGVQVEIQKPRTIQYHGDIRNTKCTTCDYVIYNDENTYQYNSPICPVCGNPLRPDVTLYGENIKPKTDYEAKKSMRDCDLFIVMGTSGRSGTVDRFMRAAKFEGSTTILINKTTIPGYEFDYTFIGDVKEMIENNITVTIF
jgi:NAD-dependent deacetylase